MADPSLSPSGRTTNHPLDSATAERLLALLQDELARASREALEGGTSPQALAAEIEQRIARLRRQIDGTATEDPSPGA